MNHFASLWLAFSLLSVAQPALAVDSPQATLGQQTSEETLRERYRNAAEIQGVFARNLILNRSVSANWINGSDIFWYERQVPEGKRFMIVEAERRARREAFDHRVLASALSEAGGKEVQADKLPISGLSFGRNLETVEFEALGKRWRYRLATSELTNLGAVPTPALLLSPDASRGAFLKDGNLWLRDMRSGAERQLTTDGEHLHGYGVETDAFGKPVGRPQAVWSPDSRTLFTARLDERQVAELPMVDFVPKDGSLRPQAYSYRVALPGDEHVPTFEMLAIHTDTGRIVRADYPALAGVRMNDTPFSSNRAAFLNARLAYFVDFARGEQKASLVEFDIETGKTRKLFVEEGDGFIDLGPSILRPTPFLLLDGRDELVWYSDRSGIGQLYLYDLRTGKVKRQLTSGSTPVRDVIGMAGKSRQLIYTRGTTKKAADPYRRELVAVDLDNGRNRLIEQLDADIALASEVPVRLSATIEGDTIAASGLSPSGRYVVRTAARADGLADSSLISLSGRQPFPLEQADTKALPAAWRWPEPVRLTAADSKTPLSGLIFRPSFQKPGERYPVIDYIYGGPQMANVPQAVAGKAYLEAASLAELGFVVVVIDGRGTPERSRAFHQHVWRQVDHASELEDHVAGIRQLAAQRADMDLERIGIYGFSGGGYMTGMAMLRFPEFFKVGVAGGANTDQRLFWHSWGERYNGMPEGDNYLQQALPTHAARLSGKLLLIHGMNDFWVHPAGMFQLMQALQDANKDFDTVLMPQEGHALNGYAQRRMWAYFLQHLRGEELPAGLHHRSQQDQGTLRTATQSRKNER
ncbi:prolyl oligopeptidase family serine peptidase [Sandaracinobacter sp. RS1-74]|uniref:S9 family peptidase n=1 Tax=Sandaracinobacteroides sayramensis TaxID=2913411 RepID=UPI001EDA9062|nr:prolyl oligopeptidase family serine peptidase [Sandaracinobacteroides sayramensis]MCG2842578.1 prolyl oligopeptidase family serine peptidase [Sandaracinobacteroides sayramensis]